MSCAEVFSYALLLKGDDRADRILELLAEETQEAIKAGLGVLRGLSSDEIRQRWVERRKADELSMAISR